MARLYLLVCDACKKKGSSPRDTNKLPGWTELSYKSRPLVQEGTDFKASLLICNECTDKFFVFLRSKLKLDLEAATIEYNNA